MGRIKLPGKEKNKKIVLVILVIIALGVIVFQIFGSKTNENEQNKNQKQEEIINPTNIGESSNNDTTKKDLEKLTENSSKGNNQDLEAKKEYSARENALYDEAYNLFFSHKYSDAISKAGVLINEFPNSAKGYNIRGIAKAYNGDYDGGIEDIDKSLSIDNNYGYARFNKALTYELYGKMEEALKWYNKALEIEDYVWSYYGIASIYGRKGDVGNTMVYLDKAIKLDAGVKEIAKNEHDFDPVKNSKEFQKAVNN